MTDIRQHLPIILACVRTCITSPDAPEQLRASLREQLPASYGIGAGRLMASNGRVSQAFTAIIYDKTLKSLPTSQSDEEEPYDIRQALAVITLAHDVDADMLKRCLQDCASAKRLLPPPPATQKPGKSFKGLLPLAIVACERLTDTQQHGPEHLALMLDALLKQVEERLRPDYLIAQSHQLLYSNPLLTGDTFVASTINIAREIVLKKPHPCYVCKQRFSSPHFFYDSLCLRCGDLNYRKRSEVADLHGRVALVTGARVKIGYATALRLLRAGAHVITTTRFPHDAARRYSSEPDFADWQDRLHIYGLDFRHLPVLEHFIAHLHDTYPALDILINNAAQTIRHPADYYASLLPFERLPLHALTPAQQQLLQRSHAFLPMTPLALPSEELPRQATTATLPDDYTTSAMLAEQHEAQAMLPPAHENSWTLPLDEIDLTEFLEVQVINVTAPFLLISRLLPLLRRSAFPQRFIINVSAVEGQFAQSKQGTHVHTNMAKASLNMLTHSAAAQLARDAILLNSVDPGWISQQGPVSDLQSWEKLQRLLPLDLLDASSRVCDPIFTTIRTGEIAYGSFYKDYQCVTW